MCLVWRGVNYVYDARRSAGMTFCVVASPKESAISRVATKRLPRFGLLASNRRIPLRQHCYRVGRTALDISQIA